PSAVARANRADHRRATGEAAVDVARAGSNPRFGRLGEETAGDRRIRSDLWRPAFETRDPDNAAEPAGSEFTARRNHAGPHHKSFGRRQQDDVSYRSRGGHGLVQRTALRE